MEISFYSDKQKKCPDFTNWPNVFFHGQRTSKLAKFFEPCTNQVSLLQVHFFRITEQHPTKLRAHVLNYVIIRNDINQTFRKTLDAEFSYVSKSSELLEN